MSFKTVGAALVWAVGIWTASACTAGEPPEEGTTEKGSEARATASIGAQAGDSARLVAESPALLARVKVTDGQARAAALAAVSGAAITAAELEEEGGSLIYSYDVQVAGREGVEEVHVDALTGTVLSKEHEDPSDEADEADEPQGSGK